MTQVRIRRIQLSSLLRHGCLLGVALAALPSIACGLGLLWVSRLAESWITGWQEMTIRVLGRDIAQVDLVAVLGLQRVVDSLHVVTAASPLVLAISIFWLTVVAGLLLAAAGLLLGLVYNGLASLTGGIVVEVRAAPPDTGRTSRE